MRPFLSLFLPVLLVITVDSRGAEWDQFRGSAADGKTAAFDVAVDANSNGNGNGAAE